MIWPNFSTLTNCSNNYGSHQSVEKFIPRSITNLIQNIPISIYGDGKNVRDWLHVKDHCNAIELVIKKSKAGETYIVGGSDNDVSNLEIAKMIIDLFSGDESMLKFVKDRPGHDRKYAVDYTKIQQRLGWEPQYTLKRGLKKTIKWYKEQGVLS